MLSDATNRAGTEKGGEMKEELLYDAIFMKGKCFI